MKQSKPKAEPKKETGVFGGHAMCVRISKKREDNELADQGKFKLN